MLMCATAHVECTDTIRERVCTESFLREKNPVPHRGLEPASVLRLAFQLDALPMSCPCLSLWSNAVRNVDLRNALLKEVCMLFIFVKFCYFRFCTIKETEQVFL